MKKKIFFVLNKYQSVTHVSTLIFQGLSKNMVFRSAALVIKKDMVYFRIFQRPDFFRPVPNPICIKKSLQNFKMIVSKILQGGAKRPPPSAYLQLMKPILMKIMKTSILLEK